MGDSDIVNHLKDLESQSKNIKMELFRACWYMRGGVTLQEAYHMSPDERSILGQLVKENMDTTKKSGLPFF
jgi:hypothetical protein